MISLRIAPVLAALALVPAAAAAQSPELAPLKEMYERRDCFAAREAVPALGAQAAGDAAFYRGWVAAAFNRPAEAEAELSRFLAAPGDSALRGQAEELLADTYLREHRYGAAADVYARLLAIAPDSAKADLRNSIALFGALRDVPPQTVSFAGDVDVPTTRDKANLVNLPVQSGGAAQDFIFDTGANLSTVTESAARALGFRVIEQAITVGAATGSNTLSRLAVAPELRIGAATVRNVVFLVLPDSALAFPQIGYAIHGILGHPVITALGEVTLTRAGRLRVPARPSPVDAGAAPNLCLDGFDPLVRVTVRGEPLVFGLDTGARQSSLYPAFYERYRAMVDSGTATTRRVGGAGGIREIRVVSIGPVALGIGASTVTLQQIDVMTQPTVNRSRFAFGVLGQDVVASFAEMTLDYRAMQLRFR